MSIEQDVFTDWFTRNYPPNCTLSVPEWHAQRIFRAAKQTLTPDQSVKRREGNRKLVGRPLNEDGGAELTVVRNKATLLCMDCNLPYTAFGLDTMLPDEQWAMIHDSPGGVLCANCIVNRAAKKIPTAIALRARIDMANTKVAGPQEPQGVGFEHWRDFTHPQVLRYIEALKQQAQEASEQRDVAYCRRRAAEERADKAEQALKQRQGNHS